MPIKNMARGLPCFIPGTRRLSQPSSHPFSAPAQGATLWVRSLKPRDILTVLQQNSRAKDCVFSDNSENIPPFPTVTISEIRASSVIKGLGCKSQKQPSLFSFSALFLHSKLWIFCWIIVPFCCELGSAKSLHTGDFSSFLVNSGYSFVHFTAT